MLYTQELLLKLCLSLHNLDLTFLCNLTGHMQGPLLTPWFSLSHLTLPYMLYLTLPSVTLPVHSNLVTLISGQEFLTNVMKILNKYANCFLICKLVYI